MKEEWRDIKDYEGVYQVSNLGRVRRMLVSSGTSGGILSPILQNGYTTVMLCKDGNCKRRYIHRLVADAFLGPVPEKHYVHHIDGNRVNAKVGNLAYMKPGAHKHHHFIEECLTLQPGQKGSGITMFD